MSPEVSGAKKLVEADIVVGSEPLIISTPGYVDVRWMSLVESDTP